MGIVIELQREALTPESDILSLLRKAYLVARKLKLKDFEAWINKELNGYKKNDKVPRYRVYHGSVTATNPMRGQIPVVIPNDNSLSTHEARDPIANLKNVYETSEGNFAYIHFGDNVNAMLSHYGNTPIVMKFQLQISTNLLYNTFESVRNMILDWAITLEEKGIAGENLQFTKEEMEIAKSEPTINNINYFFGDVTDTQIQQGTESSNQEQ